MRIASVVRMLILTVLFTALVFVATIALQLYIPATGGYFNLGESMIYTVAVLAGPYVALIAGGIGSALADVVTGYAVFAPGTLIIKAVEGFVVGFIVWRARRLSPRARLGISLAIAIAIASMVYWIGVKYLSGEAEVTALQMFTFIPSIPSAIWIGIAVIIAIAIIFAGYPRAGRGIEALAMLCGGLTMVTGYFLYEYFISNPLLGRPPIAAIAEVIPNLGQCLIGITIAIPLVNFIEKAWGLPTKSRESKR